MVRVAPVLVLASAVALPAASPGATTKDLHGWASPGNRPVVGMSGGGFSGPLLKHVRPGTYRLHLKASDSMPFRLIGPGVTRRTPTGGGAYTVYKSWTIRLRKGRYHYSAEGFRAAELRANGFRTSGSFLVP